MTEALGRQQDHPRFFEMVVCSIILGVFAIIGLAFGAGALRFIGSAVRTTATVVSVSAARDLDLAKTKHMEFKLRFTEPDGKVITEQTDQVVQVPTVPARGDTLQVYYTASDPSDVTDARYGWPGEYDAIIGWTVIIIILRRWKRRATPKDS